MELRIVNPAQSEGERRGHNGDHTEERTTTGSIQTRPMARPQVIEAADGAPALSAQGDKRIEWCRANIPGFKAMNDQVVKSRREVEENRRKYEVRP